MFGMVLIQEIVAGEFCHSDMFIGPPHLVRNIQPQYFTLLVGVLFLHNPGVGLVEVGLLDYSKLFTAIILCVVLGSSKYFVMIYLQISMIKPVFCCYAVSCLLNI